jgi:hypothetical protein
MINTTAVPPTHLIEVACRARKVQEVLPAITFSHDVCNRQAAAGNCESQRTTLLHVAYNSNSTAATTRSGRRCWLFDAEPSCLRLPECFSVELYLCARSRWKKARSDADELKAVNKLRSGSCDDGARLLKGKVV